MSGVVALALLATFLPACNLLSTRDPQPPEQQSNFVPPTVASIVMDNFQSAVNDRDGVAYTRCFSDSAHGPMAFRFTPAADAQSYQSKFLTWGVKDETAYFLNLKSQVPAAATMSLYLDSLQTEAVSSDSTVFAASYTLVAQHSDPSRPTQARGRMHVTVKPDPSTQLWSITQWVDVATTSDPSWSVMKARFSP